MDDIFGLEVTDTFALILEGKQVDTVRLLDFTTDPGVYVRSTELNSGEEYELFYFEKGTEFNLDNATVAFDESGWYEVCPTTDDDTIIDEIYFAGPYILEPMSTRVY